ncbi:MAG TPA: hypothetical protein VH120_10775 [Gemmataceae bacterium]|nr:hypothetical protein [Gemmataceae bacterium]
MQRLMSFLTGAAIGAVTMYYFDPDRGRGRRSMCEDRWAARGRRAVRYLDKAGRDLANRTRGLAHEAEHLVRGETPSEDGHRGLSFDIMHEHLAPGTRLFLAALGSGLVGWGLMEDAPEACVLGTIGAAIMLPAVTGRGAAARFGLPKSQEQPAESAPVRREPVNERRREAAPVM